MTHKYYKTYVSTQCWTVSSLSTTCSNEHSFHSDSHLFLESQCIDLPPSRPQGEYAQTEAWGQLCQNRAMSESSKRGTEILRREESEVVVLVRKTSQGFTTTEEPKTKVGRDGTHRVDPTSTLDMSSVFLHPFKTSRQTVMHRFTVRSSSRGLQGFVKNEVWTSQGPVPLSVTVMDTPPAPTCWAHGQWSTHVGSHTHHRRHTS